MAFAEPNKWSDWLPTAEWWYNSSYHTSIKMSPFEALYEYAPPMLTAAAIPTDILPETAATLTTQRQMLEVLQYNLAKA